ncbi:MAG: hypothetical protein Ta2D_10180 [Rickettsiales bacterium]|nr:MAG: hypothetical protein Ta2D_10180 [Rickettsiales bacterium]
MLVKCKCGIYDFTCENEDEYNDISTTIDLKTQEILKKNLTYSIKGQPLLTAINSEIKPAFISILQPIMPALYTFEGSCADVLEKNNLIFDIINNKIVNKNILLNNDVAVENKTIGLFTCNGKIKSFYGFYDVYNNITTILDYENY